MKTIIRYLSRSGVDFILLVVSICVGIKIVDSNPAGSAILSFFALYILGAIFRMGQATDIINECVTDKKYRRELNLHPVPGDIYKPKMTIFARIVQVIFWLGFIGIMTYFMFDR